MYVDEKKLVDLANQVNGAFKLLQDELDNLKGKVEALEESSVAPKKPLKLAKVK